MHMSAQQYQSEPVEMSQNGSSTSSVVRPAIERGASWSYGETKILLALWTQDIVQRQLTNSKRTRHVWQKIAERIRENGYDRTADQVRTRVFNMIAEYRRILKNPTPERRKKCIFFEALHRIYQAKNANALENSQMSFSDFGDQYQLDPMDFSNAEENGDNEEEISDEDRNELFAYSMSPTSFSGNLNDNNSNDSADDHSEEMALPPLPPKRSRLEGRQSQYQNNFESHNHQQHPQALAATTSAPFEQSAFQVLVDRMFAHLSRETEVMREWVNLERDRLAQEIARRKEEKEREERREKSFLEVLTKLQDQVFTFLSQQQQSSTTQQQPLKKAAASASALSFTTTQQSSSSSASTSSSSTSTPVISTTESHHQEQQTQSAPFADDQQH